MAAAVEGADAVFHLAALVGPFYQEQEFEKVNYLGSLAVLEACKLHRVPKLIYSSSPSTRFTGDNVRGLREGSSSFMGFRQSHDRGRANGNLSTWALSRAVRRDQGESRSRHQKCQL